MSCSLAAVSLLLLTRAVPCTDAPREKRSGKAEARQGRGWRERKERRGIRGRSHQAASCARAATLVDCQSAASPPVERMVGSAWERESARWGWGSQVGEGARGSEGRREGVKEGWMETREGRKKRMSGNGGGREREKREREKRERERYKQSTPHLHITPLPPFLTHSLPPLSPCSLFVPLSLSH